MCKSYFENGGKAHDVVVITEKYSIFPTLKGEYIVWYKSMLMHKAYILIAEKISMNNARIENLCECFKSFGS